MSNDTTSTPLLWSLDTAGFLHYGPVYISRIIYIPSAADDDLVFKTWDENSGDVVSAGTKYLKTGTITSTNTLTSTGNLPSGIADSYIFRITASTGAAANIGRHVVETAGTDDAVVIHGDDWTNEASKVYSWTTYTTSNAIVLKAGNSDASPIQVDWTANPLRLDNITLETIDGGTAYVYLARVLP